MHNGFYKLVVCNTHVLCPLPSSIARDKEYDELIHFVKKSFEGFVQAVQRRPFLFVDILLENPRKYIMKIDRGMS
jgi:hypothetical protein